ncbi:cytochrome c biogenesis protein CcsA [Nocardioides daphniae]|uniref:cytochrome c biogenesis protein CcsA n=1 Tax=Nocardioides daphniae TaxID=402297 RepID=UPI0023AF4754|nr:cytochrome c biogenesis protein CcsA [Nocardioides daphniae]
MAGDPCRGRHHRRRRVHRRSRGLRALPRPQRRERRATVVVGAPEIAEAGSAKGANSQQEGGRRGGYAASLPPASTLEQVAHTAHIFAFPVWTFAVIAGAIWAENSWGRYWGWDPKETWAFITWVFYAAHLHAQATAGWRGVRAAWFALAGYAAFLFNFFGVNLWITGLHSYAGV